MATESLRKRLYYCGLKKNGTDEKDGEEGELWIDEYELAVLAGVLKRCKGIHIQTEDESFDYFLVETQKDDTESKWHRCSCDCKLCKNGCKEWCGSDECWYE